jgi:hypothetical protein
VNPIGNDFRYSPRGFRRSPLFNALAVLSLAFGIGASTAIFSLIDQVLCGFCRYPEQLVWWPIAATAGSISRCWV